MTLEYANEAKKQFKKYMEEVQNLDDPRSRGRELTRNLAVLRRYRVGDYRRICEIKDTKMMILVLFKRDRKAVYR